LTIDRRDVRIGLENETAETLEETYQAVLGAGGGSEGVAACSPWLTVGALTCASGDLC
jgi:hypothetical protein